MADLKEGSKVYWMAVMMELRMAAPLVHEKAANWVDQKAAQSAE